MDSFDSGQLGKVINVGNWHGGVPPQLANTTTLTKSARTDAVGSTLGGTDFTVLADASGAPVTETLPAAILFPGRIFNIKKIDASANAVTIATTGGNTIDGAATKVLGSQYQSIMVQSNGAQWYII